MHISPKVKMEKQEVVVKKEGTEKKKPPIFTVDIATMTSTMHGPGSEKSEAKLVAGPNGLLVANFSDGVCHETELCNLMLLAALPKKIKKKPAAAEDSAAHPSPEGPPEADAPHPPPEDVGVPEQPADGPSIEKKPDKDYGIMYYWRKGENTIAIRAKFGSKGTVLSCGGKTCTKSKEEMFAIGNKLVKDLKEGKSAGECKIRGNQLCRD